MLIRFLEERSNLPESSILRRKKVNNKLRISFKEINAEWNREIPDEVLPSNIFKISEKMKS